MVRTIPTAWAHLKSSPFLKPPVHVVNEMNETTNLHTHTKKKKNKDLKGILTSVKICHFLKDTIVV